MSNKTYSMLEDSEGTLSGVGVNENGQHHSGAQLNTRLYWSLAEGDVEALQQQIACLPEMVSAVDESTVLHLAVHFGQGTVISFLLDQVGIKLIQRENKKGDLAFHVAARAGNLQALQSLVTWVEIKERCLSACSSSGNNSVEVLGINKSLIGRENKDKNTALHIAVHNGFEDMANVLIDAWPSASYHLNGQNICPLYWAIESKYWELVGHMLEKLPISEDVALPLREGKSVVHASIFAKNEDILARLLNVVSIEACDEEGRSPLSYAADQGFLEGVNYILEKYPNQAYNQEKDGCFPIHWAARGGNVKVINEFFKKSANTKVSVNNKGQNIFHMACGNGKDNIVKFLLKYSCLDKLINSRDEDGYSPLHLAAKHKHPGVVYLLTWDKRVQLDLRNNEGSTALDIAEGHDKHPTFLERLTWTALRYAGATRAPGHNELKSRASTKQDFMRDKGEKQFKDTTKQDSKIDKEEKQFKERVDTILLVATLVVTVTFSAGIQIPGGNENGKAPDVNEKAFQVFIICNTIAMYSSIIVTVMLLCAYLKDSKIVLVSLEVAVAVLGVALTMMSVAFMTAVYLVVGDSFWLGYEVLVMDILFVAAFVFSVIPLYTPIPIKRHFLRYIFYYPFQLLLWVSRWEMRTSII